MNFGLEPKTKTTIVGNGVVTDGLDVLVEGGAVWVRDGLIEQVGPTEAVKAGAASAAGAQEPVDFIDVGGRVILPGFLNAHHHLYSSFAAGLAPLGETDTFPQILDSLWWSLDLALDAEAVYYSALLGIVASVKHGVTMIFDHHASMGHVRGSLASIEAAFRLAGIKGQLCFEISERMGEGALDEQIEENVGGDLGGAALNGDLIRRACGLHANLTLSDEALARIARARPPDLPVHVHCGEDRADLEYCRERGYQGPVDRLHHFGLLSADSLLAHAIHLSERDYRLVEELGPVVVSNPESNANNCVGRMDRGRIRSYVLGTDGMSPDMVETLRSHYLLSGTIPFGEMRSVFFERRYAVQRRVFPGTGGLAPGTRADLAVLDYHPLTPIHLDNLLGHLIFGARTGRAYMTVGDGRVLYRDGHLTFVNETEVEREAAKVAAALHRRYYAGGAFSRMQRKRDKDGL